MIIENNQSETKRVGCYNHIEVLVQNLNQFSTKKKDDFGGFKDIGWIKDSTQDENKVVHAGVRFWIATRRCSSHSPYLSPLDFSHSLLELAIFPSLKYQVHHNLIFYQIWNKGHSSTKLTRFWLFLTLLSQHFWTTYPVPLVNVSNPNWVPHKLDLENSNFKCR